MVGLILGMGAVIIFLSYLVWGRMDVNYSFWRADVEGNVYLDSLMGDDFEGYVNGRI